MITDVAVTNLKRLNHKICKDRLWKTTETFQNSQRPSQDSKWTPPKYKPVHHCYSNLLNIHQF
jgi:hypothetical protein